MRLSTTHFDGTKFYKISSLKSLNIKNLCL
jgi:hypothetical protein